ncbi:chromate resistance protein ChrB domain-containing protein [Klenkia terrae]|uniref:chromate resistance protein ChrB domain-containing protein n=1 Tax=Klenkia terrae TaxID=1052259 RepID=UPI00360A188E
MVRPGLAARRPGPVRRAGHRDRARRPGLCTFETLLRLHELADPVLWRIAEVVHAADLDDDLFDAPEAPGVDAVVRGLTMTGTDP